MHPDLKAALEAQIEARQALNGLKEDATDEERAAAIKTLNDADQKVLEVLQAGPSNAPAELRDRISMGRYLTAIAEERAHDGAEAELNKELRLSDQAMPLEALLPTAEERADAVSPQNAAGDALPSGAINLTTGPMLDRIFLATDTAFLGIAMPTVPAGERRYPVMVGGTDAAMQARGDEPDAGAARFDIVDANPHRLTGRYVFDLEGVAEMGGLLEATLRSDLRMVMGFMMDQQVLNGTGQNNQVAGVIASLDLDLPPGAPAGRDAPTLSWANARQIATDGLDGRYARTEGDIRLLIGGETYSKLRTLYRTDESEVDGMEALRALGTRVRRSFLIPDSGAVTFKGQSNASTKKTQRAIANAEAMAAVAPVWQGITLIRDPYSNAGKGQIVLTAHMLFDFVFRRKDGWHQYGINVANAAV